MGVILAAALALGAVACAPSGLPDRSGPRSDSPAVYAVAIHYLATELNTFGPGHRFSELLVIESTIRGAGDYEATGVPGAPFSDTERAAIRNVLAPLGEVRFIASAADWRDADLQPVIPGSAILSLAPLEEIDAATAHVGVNLWCSGSCGLWTTLGIERIDGEWQVTGAVGPTAIS
jgi:hypothetical protein